MRREAMESYGPSKFSSPMSIVRLLALCSRIRIATPPIESSAQHAMRQAKIEQMQRHRTPEVIFMISFDRKRYNEFHLAAG